MFTLLGCRLMLPPGLHDMQARIFMPRAAPSFAVCVTRASFSACVARCTPIAMRLSSTNHRGAIRPSAISSNINYGSQKSMHQWELQKPLSYRPVPKFSQSADAAKSLGQASALVWRSSGAEQCAANSPLHPRRPKEVPLGTLGRQRVEVNRRSSGKNSIFGGPLQPV